jgi:FOG: EAL domain
MSCWRSFPIPFAVIPSPRTCWNLNLPRPAWWVIPRVQSNCCITSRSWACGWPWTISAPVILPSATWSASPWIHWRSTRPSWAASRTTNRTRPSPPRSSPWPAILNWRCWPRGWKPRRSWIFWNGMAATRCRAIISAVPFLRRKSGLCWQRTIRNFT